MRATKHQQLLMLHRAFDMATEDMGLRALTIVTPSLLKLVLTNQVQYGDSGQPHYRTSPLRPRQAHIHGQEVPARPGGPILHGGLRRGRIVLGGH